MIKHTVDVSGLNNPNRISFDQTQTTIAAGLDFPMGITAGPGNALYVANCGFGCRPGQGSILRFQLPAR